MKTELLTKVAHRLKRSVDALVKSPNAIPTDFPPEMVATIKKVRPYTLSSNERLFALIKAVEYVVKAGIPGDMIECGVWRGGSMMAVADTLMRLGKTDRVLQLYDTYEGMTPATDEDKDLSGQSAKEMMAAEVRDSRNIWAYAGLDDVRTNMESTGYPMSQMKFIKGRVEDTIPAQAPVCISILRIDTDWYESTKHELEHLFPRLSPAGVLVIDDYGHWQGARKAVDEFMAASEFPLLLGRMDYTGRFAIKPRS